MFQFFVGMEMCFSCLNVAYFQIRMAVFQQNMQLLSTESGENQQREKECFGVERAILSACFQIIILKKGESLIFYPLSILPFLKAFLLKTKYLQA